MRDDEMPSMQCERCGESTDGQEALCARHLKLAQEADDPAEVDREDETEQEAGRRIDVERNEQAGREINALAKLQAAGLDAATCSEEQAAAIVGPAMAVRLCRQQRRLAALGYVPD